MAQRGFAAFLLSLGLVVSNVYGEDAALCGTILNATLNNGSLPGFNLTVSPAILSSKTNYTVQLYGTGNFTVLLQASTLSSPVGNWSLGNNSCNGGPLFVDFLLSNNNIINTTWTSAENLTNVTISAYIHNGTSTFRLSQILSQGSVTNTTTEAPTTGNKTESTNTTAPTTGNNTQSINTTAPTTGNKTESTNTTAPTTGNKTESTNTTVTVATATTIQKTTSAGSTPQLSLVPMALSVIFGLLLIPRNHLS